MYSSLKKRYYVSVNMAITCLCHNYFCSVLFEYDSVDMLFPIDINSLVVKS